MSFPATVIALLVLPVFLVEGLAELLAKGLILALCNHVVTLGRFVHDVGFLCVLLTHVGGVGYRWWSRRRDVVLVCFVLGRPPTRMIRGR